jgi:hypothetical protein
MMNLIKHIQIKIQTKRKQIKKIPNIIKHKLTEKKTLQLLHTHH